MNRRVHHLWPTACCPFVGGSGGSGSHWNASEGLDLGRNIDTDPIFVPPTCGSGSWPGKDKIWMTADDLFHLSPGSPCINNGRITGAPAVDISGLPRVGRPDIGAYETLYNAADRDWILLNE